MVVRVVYRGGRTWSRIVFEQMLERDGRQVAVSNALEQALAIARRRRSSGGRAWIEDVEAPARRPVSQRVDDE